MTTATSSIDAFALSREQADAWHEPAPDQRSRACVLGWVRIHGPFDLDRLRLALGAVIRDHEILRTTFHLAPGRIEPLQIVLADGTPALTVVDLRDLQADDRSLRLAQIEDTAPTFDLAAGPLVHATVCRLAPMEQTLRLAIAACCADAQSLPFVVDALARHYGALGDGRHEEHAPSLQYLEYVAFQEEERHGAAGSLSAAFWSQAPARLASYAAFGGREAHAVIPPLDERQTHERYGWQVDDQTCFALRGLAQRLDVSARTLLLLCWQAALWRLSGSAAPRVDVASDGRAFDELAGLPGPFTRWLPCATRFAADHRLDDLAHPLEQALAEMRAHQHGLASEPATAPAEGLRTAFEYTEWRQPSAGAETTFTLRILSSRASSSSILLRCSDADGELHLTIAMNRRTCERGDAFRFGRAFEAFLRDTLAHPDAPLSTRALMAAEVARRVLVDWNQRHQTGGERAAATRGVSGLIAAQAIRQPDAPAIRHRGRTLTFGDVNTSVSRVAQLLRARGIGADARVALAAEPSPELLIVILGILQSGASFVPLDPATPAERLRYQLEDCGARLIVVSDPDRVRSGDIDVMTAERLVADAEHCAPDGPRDDPPGSALAYIIYTSGSTGRPKGVMVSRDALSTYLQWCLDTYVHPDGHGAPLVSSLAFDLTITSLLAPLAAGQPVTIPDATDAISGLLEVLRADAAPFSWVKLTPSHLRIVTSRLSGDELAGRFHTLIVGGEAIAARDLAAWRERMPRVSIVNEYGPTEATVGCSVAYLGDDDTRREPISIGTPIAGASLYVLDAHGEPLPPGFPGEIYIGGAGIARGYLGRPDLTAERFVPDRWAVTPGARLYRTGDRGRQRDDGTFEYLGRTDHQVKVRGHRIEPGEVEAVLAACPDVREALVTAHAEGDGSTSLAAYVIASEPAADVEPLHRRIRAFAAERLPDYMVPAFITTLDRWPLTPNGKIDRAALPEPGSGHARAPYATPRTTEEEVLCAIWAQVLRVDRVGIDDNYFDLGGDSIRAIQIAGLAQGRGLACTIELLFRHHTIREIAAHVRRSEFHAADQPRTEPFSLLTPEDRALLPGDAEDAFPLSDLQAGMIFHREYDPASAVYHDIFGYHLRLPLDLDVLRTAIDLLVARHPSLRTSFHVSGYSVPLQIVHRQARNPLRVTDLRHLSSAQQHEALLAWMEEEKTREFDHADPPLLWFQVHIRDEESFQFSLSFHHAIIDGWSDATMLIELAVSYARLLSGKEVGFDPPATQYREFVALERASVASDDHRAFWQRLIADCTPLTVPRLPGAVARDAARGILEQTVDVPRDVSDGLRQVARALAVPLKSVLLAAHLRTIGAITGTTDVLTTITAVGRPETRDGDRVIGLHLNSIPFRVAVRGGTWASLIQAAFAHERESLPYRRYPLAEIQRLSGKGRLSETSFYYTHYHIVERLGEVDGFEILGRLVYEETSFPLVANFGLDPWTSSVTLTVGCDRTQFTEDQVRRVCEYYSAALASIAANVQGRYEETALVGHAERQRTLVEWNDTTAAHDLRHGVHALVEAQAARTPDDPAVVFGDVTLTYAALNARANRLAHSLLARGAGPDTVVGLCMHRSIDMAVAVLAVLKAGAAYVPLDPAYPRERLAFMLRDTRAPILVTHESLRERLTIRDERESLLGGDEEARRASRAAVIVLDADPDPTTNEPETDPRVDVRPEQLAYVIYTSGSTGRPKGVALTHLALTNLIQWHLATLPARRRVLQFASLSFDASFHELFAAWCSGGAVVLIDEEQRRDVPLLARVLRDARIEKVILPVSVLQQLVTTDVAREGLPALREIIATGDRLQVNRGVIDFLAAHSRASLHNHYGPSETHVITAWRLADVPERCPVAPPIGRPIANCVTYVLDPQLQPVPTGTQGELYLGGVCLARGYHGRPDLTAEKFVPHPLARTPGERLYRTGDLARYLPDGTLEFIGRRDYQVKIRGHRVELGEVEAAIQAHPEVKEVVVIAREDQFGEQRLIAYVVAVRQPGPAPAALREHLASRLPDYMLPAFFVELPRLPLTSNDKVDRRALPDVEISDLARRRAFVPPRTGTEEAVAAVWRDLLGTDAVGVHDEFFELGGHSLVATRVVSELRRVFGIELPLRQLFDSPTVEGLADAIQVRLNAGHGLADATDGIDDETVAVGVEADGDIGSGAVLSFAQERLWIIDRLEGGESRAYHMAIALALDGSLDVPRLRRTLTALVERHAVLRTRVVETAGGPRQYVDPAPRHWMLPVIELRDDSSGSRMAGVPTVDALAAAEARRPFDLAREWPLRTTLIRLEATRHVLLATLHHVAADGWSLGVLVRDLTALYAAQTDAAAHAGDEQVVLPRLARQYVDYARWQRAWLRGPRLDALLSHWTTRLEGAPPRLMLPADAPARAARPGRGAKIPVVVSPDVTRALRGVARHHGATLFMAVLAGYAALLGRLSGQADVCIGAPIANRRRNDWEPLVGCFVNTLVLRCPLDGRPAWHDLLARIRAVTLDAYAHQDLPFERLVEAVAPPRAVGVQPLFQAMLAWQNAPMGPLTLPGLVVTPLAPAAQPAKAELTLSLREVDGGIAGTLEYDAERFSVARVAHWVQLFGRLLEQVVISPDRPVDDLPLLSDRDSSRAIAVGRATDRPIPAVVPELFDAQADARPDAPALAADDRTMSYADLRRAANRLAHALISLGVGSERRVGICLERGCDLVVSLLATLKAGGAYVPLDPAYPRERLAQLFAQARPDLIITTSALRSSLPKSPARTLCLDRDRSWLETWPISPPAVVLSPDALAYVMFTSGSTGGPKAVAVPHRAIVRLVRDTDYATFQTDDTFLQFSPASFDASVFEIWGALLNGARLVIAPPGLPSLDDLGSLIETQRVTTLWTTAGLFTQMVDTQLQRMGGVRQWLAGGDVLSPVHVRRALEAWPSCRIVNGYGPTENTTFTCCHTATPEECATSVPIGRPIARTSVYVLDRSLQLVPADVVGELYAAGEGLARGYADAPAWTAERFLPDPLALVPGARMYRTGDRVRWRQDGTLEFVGRIDHQLKIRGFRVEPSEIAAAMLALEGVRDAVVAARDDGAGGKFLAGYVVMDASDEGSEDRLRQQLAARLPDYMVPHAIVTLDALPLTPNGKIDLRALPPPAPRARPARRMTPRTDVEAALFALFAEVLPTPPSSVEDGFFELGGDSIQALQLVARANAAGLRLTPRQVFEAQTIEALAAITDVETGAPAPLPDASVAGPIGRLPMTEWFFEQRFEHAHHWNQSVRLAPRQPLAASAVRHAFAAVLRHHDALRSRFVRDDERWTQHIDPLDPTAARRAFAHVDLRLLDDDRLQIARARAERQAQASLSLEDGPLCRAVWFDGGAPQRITLALVLHHLVTDGYSWRVLLDDLSSAVTQLDAGHAPTLPAKSASIRQWAAALESLAGQEALAGDAAFWLAQAEKSVPRLPRDGSGAVNLARSLRVVSFTIDTAAIGRASADAGGSTASAQAPKRTEDLLLAAFADAYWRWTGHDRLLVALEHHGRHANLPGASPASGRGALDLSRTVGWFTTIFPLALDLDLTGDAEALLASIARQRRTVPHDGAGYGLLRYLGRDGDLRNRLAAVAPEISLNYLGQFDSTLASGPFAFAGTLDGSYAPSSRRPYLLDVTASRWEERLHVSIAYSVDCHATARVDALAALYRAAIVRLGQSTAVNGASEGALVDDAAAGLDEDALDRLLDTLER